jgi:hypothetical protein
MNRTQRRIWFLILMIALLVIPSTVVFAKELGLLTITGPGIKGEISLNNHDDMMNLEQSGFFDQARSVNPPENLGQGYNITAHLNLDGKLVPMVQMVYYPADDQWAQLPSSAETALRNLMTANKITIQPAVAAAPAVVAPAVIEPAKSEEQAAAQPASASSSASTAVPQQTYYQVGIALTALILILLGAGVILKRRTISQRSA